MLKFDYFAFKNEIPSMSCSKHSPIPQVYVS